MKKLIVMAAVAAAMSLTACSGSKTETAEEDEIEFTTPEAVVSALNERMQSGDVTTISEAVESVQEELLEIIDDGDMKKAQAYASQIEVFINENAEKLEQMNINVYTLNRTIDALMSIPNAAGQTARSKAEEAKAKAQAAEEAAKAQADAAVEAAKAQADAAVEAGKAKVNETVEEGKAKANEAVQDAADKANKAASDAINDAVNKIKL